MSVGAVKRKRHRRLGTEHFSFRPRRFAAPWPAREMSVPRGLPRATPLAFLGALNDAPFCNALPPHSSSRLPGIHLSRSAVRKPSQVLSSVRRPHPKEATMPRISYFYGIIISMFWHEGQHSTPHFHATYGEHEASLNLDGTIIAGSLPNRALRLVQEWAKLHTEELRSDWELAVQKQPLKPIDPLR